MKIHIFTIHYAHNYGAVLQAYALKTFLERLGHEVKFINHIPKTERIKYSKKLRNEVGIRYAIKNRKVLDYLKGYITVILAQKEWSRRYDEFDSFISKQLLGGDCLGAVDTIKDLSNIDTDVFICGSDQIWNESIVGASKQMYFLGFPTNAKKIAYSASMGKIKKFDGLKEVGWLTEFDAISVREDELQKMLQDEYHMNDIHITLDPCLILEEKYYASLLKDNYNLSDDDFVLAYFISENGLMKTELSLRDSIFNKKIIEVHWKRQIFQCNKNQRNDLGVGDFLAHIKKADMVITDSFHGVVFSILFHKRFWVLDEDNIRIKTLLKKLDLETQIISKIEDICITEIDWIKVESKLDKLRKESQKYLINAIGD